MIWFLDVGRGGWGNVGGCARGEMEVGCGFRDEIGGVDDHEATRRLMVTFVVLPEDRWG